MLRLYRSLVRSKLDYGRNVYGSARKSFLQMLDPIHNQGLRLCLGSFRTSPVESLYVDAHEPCLGARRAKLSLQYASKIRSLPKHPTHDAVFDNKYMKLFDARPNAISTFGLRIKQFFNCFQHWLFRHFGNTFIFCVTTLVLQATEDCARSGASEERSHKCICLSAAFHGNTRQVPWSHSCLYRWFTGWKFCGLCYSFSIRQRNFHEIARLIYRIYCWSLGNH